MDDALDPEPARWNISSRDARGVVVAPRGLDGAGVPARPAAGVTSRRLPRARPGFEGYPEGSVRGPHVPSALVYGADRDLVNLVLYALAEEVSPGFRWLQVRAPGEPVSAWDPVTMGWIGSERVWSIDALDGLEPDHARANAAIFELVRSDEPPATLQRLADFLRLPETLQRIVSELSPSTAPHLLVVANSDRIAGAIPDATIGPILDALEWARCSLFAGFVGSNPPANAHFTHVVRVDGDSPARWQEARIHFERESLFKGARLGGAASPLDLPSVARVFRRASP
jgi:hypothetical protein